MAKTSAAVKSSEAPSTVKQPPSFSFSMKSEDPGRSLFIFSETNVIRAFAKGIIESKWFETIVILTIAANCVSIAMEVHLPQGDKSDLVTRMEILEPVFLGIFTVEAVLKIIAMGFIWNKGAYLHSIFNILDFLVVTAGLIMANLSSDAGIDLRTFRAIRVLRPLKLVSGVPSLQVVLTSILLAMVPLFQIGLLVLFAIVIFAIIGLELYRGAYHYTCFRINDSSIDNADIRICSPYVIDSCADGYICKTYWDGPFFGLINFDNIGYAMLTVFQCITMEGWTDVLYVTNKAMGNQWNTFYFVAIIILGSFFMLNLILGVLSGEFQKERDRVMKRRAYVKLREFQKDENLFEGYLQWIETGEEIEFEEDKITQKEKKQLQKYRKSVKKASENSLHEEEEEPIEEDYVTEKKNCCYRLMHSMWCSIYLREMRFYLRRLTKTQLFYWTVIVLVLLNTLCVAMEHYKQPKFLEEFLFYQEYVFLSLFMAEMLIKIFGLGIKEYFRSKFNVFDFLVIAISSFEVLYQVFKPNNSFGFSALRCIRLLRLLKLTRYWPTLRNLVLSLLNSMRSIISLLVLLGLFIFVLTLLGMQLFGGDFNFDEDVPTLNFNTFSSALITVFVILTGENWNEIMYNGVRSQIAVSGSKESSMVYSIYFFVIVLFGNYTLLNVFLAIAVDNLTNAAELSAAEEEEKEEHEKQLEEAGKEEMQRLRSIHGDRAEEAVDMIQKKSSIVPSEGLQTVGDLQELAEIKPLLGKRMLPYSSLFILSPSNFIRRLCHFIVNLRFFDLFIMMVIFASSIALAAEDTVLEESLRNEYLEKFDLAFTAVFLTEMVLKVVDLGLLLHPDAYMRDPWNLMDMVVVIMALFSIFFRNSKNLSTIKSLRVLRVLRPLKTINRVPQLKAVFNTVINSVKNVFNILIVYVLFQFIFAVIAVQLFMGKFYYCNDRSKLTMESCRGYYLEYSSKMEPRIKAREWNRQLFCYDNLVYSMITLFTVTSGEGWPTVLENSMFATFQNMGPIVNFRKEMAAFYVVFFVVFPFFFVNIFVALIIITFQDQGESDLANMDLDKNQKKCIDFAINAKPFSRYMPQNKQSICYKMWCLVLSPPFETFIMILIGLNSITLVLKSHSKSPGAASALDKSVAERIIGESNQCMSLFYLNIAFTIIFTIECLMKMIAFQFKYYFKDPWNVFDLFTVIGSILDVCVSLLKTEENTSSIPSLGFLRLFRALRLIKLLRQGYSIRILLWTFIQSFKALPWVCLLIGLLFFIYCIIGMQIFGNIEFIDETQINAENNFRTFFMGLLLLFRCATGESWHLIMLDTDAGKKCACTRPLPGKACNATMLTTCGSSLAYPYFTTFILVTTFLMLNLFVAVIMDNFDYLTRDSSILGPHHLDEFLRVWALYDPLARGWLHYEDMYRMIRRLEPPLGFGRKCPSKAAYMKLIRMNMLLNDEKRVNFNATLFALIRESLLIKMGPANEMDTLDQELRTTMLTLWPRLAKKNKIDIYVPMNRHSCPLTVGKIYVGMMLKENWNNYKNWLARMRLENEKIPLPIITPLHTPSEREILRRQMCRRPIDASTDNTSLSYEYDSYAAKDFDDFARIHSKSGARMPSNAPYGRTSSICDSIDNISLTTVELLQQQQEQSIADGSLVNVFLQFMTRMKDSVTNPGKGDWIKM